MAAPAPAPPLPSPPPPAGSAAAIRIVYSPPPDPSVQPGTYLAPGTVLVMHAVPSQRDLPPQTYRGTVQADGYGILEEGTGRRYMYLRSWASQRRRAHYRSRTYVEHPETRQRITLTRWRNETRRRSSAFAVVNCMAAAMPRERPDAEQRLAVCWCPHSASCCRECLVDLILDTRSADEAYDLAHKVIDATWGDPANLAKPTGCSDDESEEAAAGGIDLEA